MQGTALVYSSHDRSNYIHNEFIVQRALRGRDNHRILFLPMSETPQNGSELERQEYSYGTFRWFFSFYDQHGLEYMPFYWTSRLSKQDVDLLWQLMWTSEVVILGGGHSLTGLLRYKELGARFDGEPGKFGRLLHERQQRGLLTVGFSAGADQLCEYLFNRVKGLDGEASNAFGLVRNTLVTLHHDPSRNDELSFAAQRFPHCMAFGLPNDSGLNVDSGILPSGNLWQVIEFVIDKSWDEPTDQWHIRTRAGSLIEHFDRHGRHWAFQGGDTMIRIQSPDNHFHDVWMTSGGRVLNYFTQQPSDYHSVEHILASH